MTRRRWWSAATAAVAAAAAVILFFRPLDPQPVQWADDALYFRTAAAISEQGGDAPWMGPFDATLLSKAPFFAVVTSLAHDAGIPFRVLEFLLFVPLPWLFRRALDRSSPLSPGATLFAGAAALLFVPAVATELRFLRTNVNGAMVLAFLVTLAGAVERFARGRGASAWLAGAGLLFGLLSCTREEASWLLVPLAAAIVPALVRVRRGAALRRSGAGVAALAAGAALPIATISALNAASYGVPAPSLRQDAAFQGLFQRLASLDGDARLRYVPVSTAARERAYAASPTLAKLRPFLEGPATDEFARNLDHHRANDAPPELREFFVSNFEFALERAIALAGYGSGGEMRAFARAACAELDAAIASGRLPAGHHGLGLLPPVTSGERLAVGRSAVRSLWLLATAQGLDPAPCGGGGPENAAWHAFLGTWPCPVGTTGTPRFVPPLPTLTWPYRILFPFALVAGFFAAAWSIAHRRFPPAVLSLLVGWAAVGAFCLAMGLVDVVGWPLLRWPAGYNRMGFFPLHFLALVSIVCAADALRARRAGQMPTVDTVEKTPHAEAKSA